MDPVTFLFFFLDTSLSLLWVEFDFIKVVQVMLFTESRDYCKVCENKFSMQHDGQSEPAQNKSMLI